MTSPIHHQTCSNAAIDHTSFESLPIKNKFFHRALTLTALRTTANLYKHPGVFAVLISKWHLVKTGPDVHLSEAVTMKFIAENTSIPVPKVYCSFIYKNRTYIVMERVRGRVLHAVWGTLSEKSRQDLLHQLKLMFDGLRALERPRDVGVQNCVGGSLYDSRIPHCRHRFGPFKNIQDFHLWLREEHQLSSIEEKQDEHQDWREIKEMAVRQDGAWPPPVFTHGDLNPFNILVRNGKIVSIIDWEFSGWYPPYWEYTSAWYGNRLRPYWQNVLDKFLEPYPDDLKMEITRQKWWGDF
jgi:aminoglycoside phosphotransferase